MKKCFIHRKNSSGRQLNYTVCKMQSSRALTPEYRTVFTSAPDKILCRNTPPAGIFQSLKIAPTFFPRNQVAAANAAARNSMVHTPNAQPMYGPGPRIWDNSKIALVMG